ncbi:MAG: hypothetical protein K0R50_4473 [Eubacterium sp.]|nr:hypothetical protein [Eubacterium sp.]
MEFRKLLYIISGMVDQLGPAGYTAAPNNMPVIKPCLRISVFCYKTALIIPLCRSGYCDKLLMSLNMPI